MQSSKRQRASPRLSDIPSHTTSSSDREQVQINKSSRMSNSNTQDRALLCTLPPTCNPPHNKPTPIANSRDLEIHYGKYHAHVCEQKGCGCVFPDARLLELHLTECHDSLAAVRKERGEKIFACHLVSCSRLFATPKARRLHLIQAHSYPKEYFFAVTNKGVGGLLKRWGDGASMIRGTWKPREGKKGNEEAETEEGKMQVDLDSASDEEEDENEEEDEEDEEEEDDDDDDEEEEGGQETPKVRHNDFRVRSPASSPRPPSPRQPSIRQPASSSARIDDLAQSMSALSLVPPSIRFGRGGKSGGFMHPELHNPQVSRGNFGPRGRGRARIATNVHPHAGGHVGRGGGGPGHNVPHRGGHGRGFPPRGRGAIMNGQTIVGGRNSGS